MNISAKGTIFTLGIVVATGVGLWRYAQMPAEERAEKTAAIVAKPGGDETRKDTRGELETLKDRLARIEDKQHELSGLRKQFKRIEEEHRRLAQALESALNLQAELMVEAAPEDGDWGLKPWSEPSPEEEAEQVVDHYDTHFSHEPDDPQWSIAAEENILNVLDTVMMEGSRILSVDCQSTLCRVEVNHDSEHSRRRFLDNIPMTAPFDTSGFHYPFGQGEEGAGTVLYLARAGYGLPSSAE